MRSNIITRKCFAKGCENHWYESVEGEVDPDNGDLSPVAITALCRSNRGGLVRQTVYACSLGCGIKLLEQAREKAAEKKVASAAARAQAAEERAAAIRKTLRRGFGRRLASALGRG